MQWNPDLYNICKDHVADSGATGTMSHKAANGDDLNERVAKVGGSTGSLGENLSYGFSDSKEVVL